jgi:hypothetical protein
MAGNCCRVGLSDCFAVDAFWVSGLGIAAFLGEVIDVAALSACCEQFEDAFLTRPRSTVAEPLLSDFSGTVDETFLGLL